MQITRKARSLAAILALLGVLFTQLAVAAYACPLGTAPAAAIGSDEGCCGKSIDASNPALCHAHCQQGNQAPLDKTPASAPDSGPGLWITLPSSPASPDPPGVSRGALPLLLARDTAPSLAVRLCCLRF